MDREPAPLRADYATLIAGGVVYTLAADGGIRGVLVMMPRAGDLFVENVAVDPAFQGRGLGRQLLAFAERAARAARLGAIRLYTNEVMTENLEFYGRLGFVEEARRMEDGYSRVFLRKGLAPA
jgi:ribosomal protein S18 acetylase RimI-like enzyme